MQTKLVFYTIDHDEEIQRKLMTDEELIKFVDESDFTNVSGIQIFDITNPQNIFEISYVGWQPNCLIEFVDNRNEVVLRGYGTDH